MDGTWSACTKPFSSDIINFLNRIIEGEWKLGNLQHNILLVQGDNKKKKTEQKHLPLLSTHRSVLFSFMRSSHRRRPESKEPVMEQTSFYLIWRKEEWIAIGTKEVNNGIADICAWSAGCSGGSFPAELEQGGSLRCNEWNLRRCDLFQLIAYFLH